MLSKQMTNTVIADPDDEPPARVAKPAAASTTKAPADASNLQQAKNAANVRNKLGGGFKPKERTPSPSEERDAKPLVRGATKLTKASIFDNDDEQESKPAPVMPKKKLQMPIFDNVDEDE